MKQPFTIKSFFFKNAYLLILAAWLLTFSFLFQYYWSYTSAPIQVKTTLENNIKKRQSDFERLITDKKLMQQLYEVQYNAKEFSKIIKKDYFIFLAHETPDGPELKFWNTQIIQPELSLWLHEDGQWFQKLINGYYVVSRKTIVIEPGKIIAAIALIPVKWEYFVTTNDLNNSFAYIPSIEAYYNVSETPSKALAVANANKEVLFWLTEKTSGVLPLSFVTILFRLLAFACCLLWLHKAVVEIALQNSFLKGAFFLMISLLAIRVLSYYFPFPLNFRQFELFDPVIYGSNFILKSLGDLLLNVLLLLWVLLFCKYYAVPLKISPFLSNKFISGALPAAFVFLLTLLFGYVIRSLVADSKISFNVTDFFSLSAYSFVGFFVLGCLAFCYYLLLEQLVQVLKAQTNNQLLIQLLLIIVSGFLFLTITINSVNVPFNLGLLLWLLLVIVLIQWNRKVLVFLPSGGKILFWLFFFSVSLTLLLLTENGKKEWADRKRMAEKLSLQTDPSAENLLSLALSNFRTDFLQSNFNRFSTQGGNQFLKDSLLGEHFSGYLNKFDTRIFTYNAKEESLFNDDSTAYNTLNTIYNLQSKNSAGDWKYYEQAFDKFYYLAKKEVRDNNSFSLKGYVFVLSKPRRYSGEKFYPELFSKTFNLQSENSPSYAYAIYKNGELINSYNDYPFPIHSPKLKAEFTGFNELQTNSFSELWYSASPDRAVVVVKRIDGWLQAITLFAYLFLVFLIMWAAYRLFRFVIANNYELQSLRQKLQLNFRTQVHATITAISIISFLVIGISTIFFFINRHSRTNKERLSRTIQIMQGEVEQALQAHAIFDDVLKVYDEIAAGELQNKVNRISEIHGVDVNVYDPEGNLRLSSQPYYYNKGLLSRKMEPLAYYKLTKLFLIQTIETEKVGSRNYMSIYVPVRDEKGSTYAYINIPYFTSQNELKQEISSFLVTLINLNAFIFLIAGLFAFFVTNRITASFSFISEKMKEIKLGKSNEAIVWKRNDEIGELVTEYNKMVNQLEESAALLAKSEREGAWREMARQVAHEIKNPLTPMKLSIQYLQKAISNNDADTKTISQSVAKTLVEQIDYLSNIASEFSNFANIGSTKLERMNLVESLQSVTNLFRMNDEIQVHFQTPVSLPLYIMGDKTQVNRLFTNLVRNAVEAVATSQKPIVELSYVLENHEVTVLIKDNGDGIDEDLQEKIFYPNFTTKTSGTGLGLAMCKSIVEQMKGSISFETESGTGTTFFVKLPVV